MFDPYTMFRANSPELFRLSVKQFHRMIDLGLFADEDGVVELLCGILIKGVRKTPQRSFCISTIQEQLLRVLNSAEYLVSNIMPITMSDSEVLPDVTVVRGTNRQFKTHHPSPQDVPLLIEIVDKPSDYPKSWKPFIYAAHNIASWIVNLEQQWIEVYSEPTGNSAHPDYLRRQTYQRNELIPIPIDGKQYGSLTVADLLP